MNLASAISSLTAPTSTAAADAAKQTARADDERQVDRKQEDFQKLLREEVDRKKAIADATPLPQHMMPWQQVHDPYQPTDEEEQAGISAASALSASERVAARAFAAGLVSAVPKPLTVATPVKRDDAEPLAAPVAQVAAPSDQPAPVHVMVEANLPPVQPLDPNANVKQVPMADFPQLVAGTARQMVKDDKPITQLDFEIHPPHVGPVSMSVSLQEKVVSVQLTVPTIQAKQMLESQSGSISTILQASNLTPGKISIVTAPAGRPGSGSASQKGDQQQAGFGLLNGGRKRAAGQDDMTATNV